MAVRLDAAGRDWLCQAGDLVAGNLVARQTCQGRFQTVQATDNGLAGKSDSELASNCVGCCLL